MKQCPNPNCILYTRLEELPDAYVKCPGCGGQLVGVAAPSRQSGNLLQPYGAPDPYGADDDDPYAPIKQYVPPPSGSAMYDDDAEFADPFVAAGAPPMQQSAGQPYLPTQSRLRNGGQWTTTSKVAFAAGSLLLIMACGLLGWIFTSKFFPQSRVIASPQATETTLASLRPPVNTPIAVQPTADGSQAALPFATVALPTAPPVVAPTQAPQTQPAPTQIQVQVPPSSNPQPGVAAPTAPPAQQQPSNGVIDAHMAEALQGGQPVGSTNQFGSTQPFNVAVQATFGPGAVTSVLTRWYGPDGALIYSMDKPYTRVGTYYAGFTIRKSGPWAPGNYRVDIHTNGSPTPSYSVPFTVVP